jgi:hypothetical protein
MSFAAEVTVDDREWVHNRLRFATEEEALGCVRDLFGRWTAVRDTRVVASDAPVNATWIDGRVENVEA